MWGKATKDNLQLKVENREDGFDVRIESTVYLLVKCLDINFLVGGSSNRKISREGVVTARISVGGCGHGGMSQMNRTNVNTVSYYHPAQSGSMTTGGKERRQQNNAY